MAHSPDRHNGQIEQLVEDFSHHRVGRRAFMQRAVLAGLSISAAASLLAACGEDNNTIDLLNVWGGDELTTFKAVCEPFTNDTKIQINVDATRDLDATLNTRIRGNNPPDIAILPNPNKLRDLAKDGKLIRLDGFLDMSKINADYSKTWLDLGSYNGNLYAIPVKIANKGTIWYSPTNFQKENATIPKTWQDMITLSDKLAGDGKYPWSMGVESAASSGWPATDWISQIYLTKYGPELYDQWISHAIPWTHASVKDAFQMFGSIVAGNHYINGAPQSILSATFQEASHAPFFDPPKAYMNYLGDFAAGFITSQFSTLKPGTEFNFFPFPTLNPQYAGAITGGSDLVVALKDNDNVHKFVNYLAGSTAQALWAKKGNITSINKSVDPSNYTNDVVRASAKMLADAPIFRYGAGDMMPSEVQQAFWKGCLAFITDTKQIDSVLNTIETTAQSAYK